MVKSLRATILINRSDMSGYCHIDANRENSPTIYDISGMDSDMLDIAGRKAGYGGGMVATKPHREMAIRLPQPVQFRPYVNDVASSILAGMCVPWIGCDSYKANGLW